MKDHIAALLMKGATSPTDPEKEGEEDEEGERDEEGKDGEEMQLEDVSDADIWMEVGDEISKEVQAAEEDVFGKDQNLIKG